MNRRVMLILLVALLVPLAQASANPIDLKTGTGPSQTALPRSGGAVNDLAVVVGVSGETGAVFDRGSPINVSFRTTRDAYVVVYNIDSEGYVHLLYPMNGQPARTDGRKTYFLPEPGSGVVWETGGKTGIEYIHAVAVEDASLLNEDELYFLSRSEQMSDEKRLRIDMDPGLAFNMIDEEIVRDAARNAPATDYTYFYINKRVAYPRYLCAKCHSPEKIGDPYAVECPETMITPASAGDAGPGYPYAELYDIQRPGEKEGDQYSSLRYGEDWNEAGEEDVDTHIYLSLGHGMYDPWYDSWYGFGWGWGWGSWDPFWWGIGWGWGWPYYGWGYYAWWRYPYYYCGGCYDPWWGWGDYDFGHDHHLRYRSIYGDRAVTKRLVDYGKTSRDLTRSRSLENTRLARSKNESTRRLERSDLRRQAIERNRTDVRRQAVERDRGSGAMLRKGRGSTRGSDLDRRMDRTTDRSRRESIGTRRGGARDDRAIDRRPSRTGGNTDRRGTVRGDSRSKGGRESGGPAVRPSHPDRGRDSRSSAPPPRSSSPPSRGGSSGSSGSSHGSSHGSGGGKTRTR